MRPAKSIDRYRSIMNSIDISPEVKHQIIENCAKYSTYCKIKSRRFNIVAVIKANAEILK